MHWAEWAALVELAAVTLFGVRAFRRDDRFGAALGALLMLASGVALWSTTRIAEKVFDHDVFWIAGIGVLNLAVSRGVGRVDRWCRVSATVHWYWHAPLLSCSS